MKKNLEKWKKAIVQLDVRLANLTSQDTYNTYNTTPSYGTAIFFKDKNQKRYLITARHVIHDQNKGILKYNFLIEKGLLNDKEMQENRRKDIEATVASKIFLVTKYEEAVGINSFYEINKNGEEVGTLRPTAFITNLEAGPPEYHPYTFSEPELDLAIISLDTENTYIEVANDLEKRGFVPVGENDLADEPSGEGYDVFSVGFPFIGASIIKHDPNLPSWLQNWSSQVVAQPLFAFGKIAMMHDSLPYYSVDISIYGGNSGGPLIQGNKLVGIISAQSLIASEQNNATVRIPFATVIKSKFIKDLLSKQREKDNLNRHYKQMHK